MLINRLIRTAIFLHLPLLAIVMFITHTHFLMTKAVYASQYFTISAHVLIECLPFFVAHHLAFKTKGHMQKISWIAGFIGYPIVCLLLQSSTNIKLLINGEDVLLCVGASALWFINHHLREKEKDLNFKKEGLKRMLQWFTLDSSVIILLITIATVIAIILTSGQWPIASNLVSNSAASSASATAIHIEVDLAQIASQLPVFISYLWQLIFISFLIYGVYLSNRYGLIRQVLAKYGVLAFFSCALLIIIVATPVLFTLIDYLPISYSEKIWPFAARNYQLVFGIIAISTPLILLFERQQHETTLAQTQQQQSATELLLLQQQINPHFLFNTLNNLYAMTLTKSDDAPQLIVKLSNLLRYTIYEGQKPQVTLAQEIAYLQDYIALEHIRSLNKCTISQQWPQNAEQYNLPPLLLVMILENAFKHGVAPATENCFIHLTVSLNDNVLTLACENSLPQIQSASPAQQKGIGLENLQRRLSLLYPNSHQFSCGPQDKTWLATLTLELTPC